MIVSFRLTDERCSPDSDALNAPTDNIWQMWGNNLRRVPEDYFENQVGVDGQRYRFFAQTEKGQVILKNVFFPHYYHLQIAV